jgi:3-phytase
MIMTRKLVWLSSGFAVLAAAACTTMNPEPTASVTAARETVRVAGSGDAADDPEVWVAPDPASSLILGTDKTEGLYVFDLQGEIVQFLPVGRLNNVDIWASPPTGAFDLAMATNRTTYSLDLFLIDRGAGEVSTSVSTPIVLTEGGPELAEPYGACAGTWNGARYAGVTSDLGEFIQYEIIATTDGLSAVEVRRFQLGSIAEGCVFDDRTGDLFIAEEEVGVWRLSTDPATGDAREMVAPIDNRRLVADVEGLTIYPEGDDAGWLVASSQGDSAYAVFALPEVAYAGRFHVLDGAVDRTTTTDGVAATAAALPDFPEGLLIIQDDADDAGGQNFKLVDWRDVAEALRLE